MTINASFAMEQLGTTASNSPGTMSICAGANIDHAKRR
jgi:hypothetical protein